MKGYYDRATLEQMGFKKLGQDVLISEKASLYGVENMSIGDHVRIDDFCVLIGNITLESYNHIAPYCGLHASMGSIVMKDYAGLSSNVTIYAASDDYSGRYLTNPTTPEKYRNTIVSDIVFEKHAIVGTGCSILPGAMLGEGAAVGSMSMVTSELGPWSINVGIPAKKRKERDRNALELEKMLVSENKDQ